MASERHKLVAFMLLIVKFILSVMQIPQMKLEMQHIDKKN